MDSALNVKEPLANGEWSSELFSSAKALRELLQHVDSTSEPLWLDAPLHAAVYRYTTVFLPMLAAHLVATAAVSLPHAQREASHVLSSAATARCRVLLKRAKADMTTNSAMKRDEAAVRRPFDALAGSGMTATRPIPPVDVAFVWLLHRLAPAAYAADCKRMFGVVLPAGDLGKATPVALHHVHAGNAAENDSVVARLQWACFGKATQKMRKIRYIPIPGRRKTCTPGLQDYLPNYLWPPFKEAGDATNLTCFSLPAHQKVPKHWKAPIEYDISGAACRQKTFLYNVCTEYYDRDESLEVAVDRYAKFMTLMRDNPGVFLVPMYDIDLVWHAHIASTAAYRKDCLRNVGRFIGHEEDDDRSPESQVVVGANRTAALWRLRYGDAPANQCMLPGTMYRGSLDKLSVRGGYFPRGIVVLNPAKRTEWLTASGMCLKCQEKTFDDIEDVECKDKLREHVVVSRAGFVAGGACGGVYSTGIDGASTTRHSKMSSRYRSSRCGGGCGGFLGASPVVGGGGCGAGGAAFAGGCRPGDGGCGVAGGVSGCGCGGGGGCIAICS
jgi:Glycine-rich domain-containing protein-like